MDSILKPLLYWKHETPLLFWGAFCFFLMLLALSLSRSLREWFKKMFVPPAPTQSLLTPMDSFRGLAALWIVLFHTTQWLEPTLSGVNQRFRIIELGNKAVPVFVILSGFLIYRALRKISVFDDLKAYFFRRFLRIWPVYFAATCVVYYGDYLGSSQAVTKTFNAFLSESLMLQVFRYPRITNPQTWSLFIEGFFYLVLPMWVICTRGKGFLTALVGLGIFTLASSGTDVSRECGLFQYFFWGILVEEIHFFFKGRIQNQWIWGSVFLFGLGMLTYDIYGSIGILNPKYFTVTLGLGFSALLLGTLMFQPAYRVFSMYPLRYIGAISYSLFIWHSILLLNGSWLGFNGYGGLENLGNAFGGKILSGYLVPFLFIPSFLFYSSLSFLLIERTFAKLRP